MTTDEACIQDILSRAIDQESENMPSEQRLNLETLCEAATSMLTKLQSRHPEALGVQSVENEGEGATAGDSEILLNLHHEVSAAHARVKRLRREVPASLAEVMAQELVSYRPPVPASLDAQDPAGQAHPERPSGAPEAEEGEMAAVPNLEAWRQLNDVTNKVPSLMARLDQTLQRLTRIIDITESDQNRPSPRTVEKVLFNRGSSEEDDEETGAKLAAAQTRKRLAAELF